MKARETDLRLDRWAREAEGSRGCLYDGKTSSYRQGDEELTMFQNQQKTIRELIKNRLFFQPYSNSRLNESRSRHVLTIYHR